MEQSALAAVRTGSWRDVSGGTVPVAATVVVGLDTATTAHILYAPDYWEGNLFLAILADVAPELALAVFVGYCLAHLVLAWLSVGWLSDMLGAFLVFSMGTGGVNNLVLFATDLAIYPRLGLSHSVAIHVIQPAAGVVAGLAIARRRGPLPWPEIVGFLVPGIVFTLFLLAM